MIIQSTLNQIQSYLRSMVANMMNLVGVEPYDSKRADADEAAARMVRKAHAYFAVCYHVISLCTPARTFSGSFGLELM